MTIVPPRHFVVLDLYLYIVQLNTIYRILIEPVHTLTKNRELSFLSLYFMCCAWLMVYLLCMHVSKPRLWLAEIEGFWSLRIFPLLFSLDFFLITPSFANSHIVLPLRSICTQHLITFIFFVCISFFNNKWYIHNTSSLTNRIVPFVFTWTRISSYAH